jgi:hypothetical protein
MFDPRSCNHCRAEFERSHMAYEVAISASSGALDFRGRYCPRCAAKALRRLGSGHNDPRALQAARTLLERRFGEPVRIVWLEAGERTTVVLCRRRHRLHDPDDRPTHREIWQ